MTKIELVAYWVETSDSDYQVMRHLFDAGDYHWSLFIGHLVIEKLMKAVFMKNSDNYQHPPRSHDLLFIAERAGISLSDGMRKALAVITTFNIQTRYPDYKKAFYNKCTYDYTKEQISVIEEVRQWMKELLG